MPADLQSFIENNGGDEDALYEQIVSHPAALEIARRYEEQRALSTAHGPQAESFATFFATYMARIEREAFDNPNRTLTYHDTRPLGWDGINYRWSAHYSRVAGSMEEREKFVYLMAHVHDLVARQTGAWTDQERQHEFALRTVCALYGGGKGDQRWEEDPTYTGDKSAEFLGYAKDHFAPFPVEKYFTEDASLMLKLYEANPNGPACSWAVRKLRPHSAGWAASR